MIHEEDLSEHTNDWLDTLEDWLDSGGDAPMSDEAREWEERAWQKHVKEVEEWQLSEMGWE